MGVINFEELRPEMVLKSDVVDQDGRILLHAGSTVNGNHIKIFRTRGITVVDVNDAANDYILPVKTKEISPEVIRKAEELIKARFLHEKSHHAFINELIRICISRKTQNL